MAFTGPSSVGPTVSSAIAQGKLILGVENKISYLEPSEAPYLRILSHADDKRGVFRKEMVKNPKIEWIEQAGVPRTDAINNGPGYVAGDTSLVVDNGAYFAAGWRVLVPRTGELFTVTSVSTNTLTVVRGDNAAALNDNEELFILQHTAQEGAGAASIILSQETLPFNYTEIVKTTFGASETLKMTNLYGGDDLDAQRFYKGIEHAIALEYRLLFSRRDIVTSGTMAKRYTGGLNYYITTNITTDTGSLTESDFNSWVQTGFNFGSLKKIAFLSGNIISTLNTFPSGKIRINDVLTQKYGMDIKEWISPFGTIYIIYHKLLTGTTYSKVGFMVDLDNVAYCYVDGRDTKLELNIQANDDDLEKDQYITEFGGKCKLEKSHSKLVTA